MEKVQLFVAYEENQKITFVVSFVGVTDGEYVYAKRTSVERRKQRKNYVRVKLVDTTDRTDNYQTAFQTKVLEMIVDEEVGLNDMRIRCIDIKSNEEILHQIEDVVDEAQKELENVIK